MIEITYTHIYMLTPTQGVTQNMPSIHQKNKYSKVQRDLSSCMQKERGVTEKIKKKYMLKKLKKHRKKCAPIKEHRKKRVKHDPLQNKGKRRISK
jgi:hypothetical protein